MNSIDSIDYKQKYLKYKQKYLALKAQLGGIGPNISQKIKELTAKNESPKNEVDTGIAPGTVQTGIDAANANINAAKQNISGKLQAAKQNISGVSTNIRAKLQAAKQNISGVSTNISGKLQAAANRAKSNVTAAKSNVQSSASSASSSLKRQNAMKINSIQKCKDKNKIYVPNVDNSGNEIEGSGVCYSQKEANILLQRRESLRESLRKSREYFFLFTNLLFLFFISTISFLSRPLTLDNINFIKYRTLYVVNTFSLYSRSKLNRSLYVLKFSIINVLDISSLGRSL